MTDDYEYPMTMDDEFNEMMDALDDLTGPPAAAEVFRRDNDAPTGDMEGLCARLDQLRLMKKRLKEEMDKIAAEEAEAEETLHTVMENEGFQSVRVTGAGTFYRYSSLYASVSEDHREEFHEWLASIRADGIIKETVHQKTLSSLVKERKEQGLAVPDYVSIHMPRKIGIRR